MNAPHLSTLAARFVENLHPARRILHAFPSFYMRRLFAAPVLPKLCGGMGTAQIQSARFYKGTVDNNGAITEADLSFTGFPTVGSVTTYAHTGAMVNIYSSGVGAENFGGVFDNTEIYHKLADLTKVQ